MTEIWLNDIDPALFAFWDTVVHRPDELCEKILRVDITIDEWQKQRAVLADVNSKKLDLAFATLFLNRTNRSGILKGGVIGGKGQLGSYKLDCRFNKNSLIAKIQRIHIYRDVIKVSRLDAKDCLIKWSKELPRRSLVNIDPPYFSQGKDLYLSFYNQLDHAELAKLIHKLKMSWMLTYDDTPEIESLYDDLPIYKKNLVYYAQVKRKAAELLVLSPRLTPPPSLKQLLAA